MTKYIIGLLVASGFVTGFLIGAKVVGIENAEMIASLVKIITVMNGG